MREIGDDIGTGAGHGALKARAAVQSRVQRKGQSGRCSLCGMVNCPMSVRRAVHASRGSPMIKVVRMLDRLRGGHEHKTNSAEIMTERVSGRPSLEFEQRKQLDWEAIGKGLDDVLAQRGESKARSTR